MRGEKNKGHKGVLFGGVGRGGETMQLNVKAASHFGNRNNPLMKVEPKSPPKRKGKKDPDPKAQGLQKEKSMGKTLKRKCSCGVWGQVGRDMTPTTDSVGEFFDTKPKTQKKEISYLLRTTPGRKRSI